MSAWLRPALPVLAGAALGALAGTLGACADGTCPLVSSWWRGALAGAVFGAFAAALKR